MGLTERENDKEIWENTKGYNQNFQRWKEESWRMKMEVTEKSRQVLIKVE